MNDVAKILEDGRLHYRERVIVAWLCAVDKPMDSHQVSRSLHMSFNATQIMLKDLMIRGYLARNRVGERSFSYTVRKTQ